MPNKIQNITALILAGGKGSRFDGQDKGLIKLNNISLVQHLIERIQPQVSRIIISANRNIKNYERFNFAVYPDDIANYAGPLAGILKALQNCPTEWLLSVPTDCPFIPHQLALRLSKNIKDHKIAIPYDGEYLQPTFALMHNSLAPSLEQFLQQGQRKTRVWMKQQDHVIVDFSDQPEAFININSQTDLENAEQHFKESMR